MIVVELPGDPRGKGRPRSRVVRTTKGIPFVAVYTDAQTRAYEKALGMMAKVAMRGRPLLTGPLAVEIIALFAVPKSWPNKKRDAALADIVRPTGSPDCDNIQKIALDALNGIVFPDDSQVVEIRASKCYSEKPRLRIEIKPLEAQLFHHDERTADGAALAG